MPRHSNSAFFRAPILSLAAAILSWVSVASGATLKFAGLEWTVREGQGGPGPNTWESRNVFVDGQGFLHLKLVQREGRWSCAEVTSRDRFGFGRYEFEIEGGIDRWDQNVVLGLFNYPTGDVGGDETHEIDIEFARWGRADAPTGNYTVWPVEKALRPTSKTFAFTLKSSSSRHCFDWTSSRVTYQSLQPGTEKAWEPFQDWTFQPEDGPRRIAQKPMPVHINLWLFKGRPPLDGKEIEVVVRHFVFRPLGG